LFLDACKILILFEINSIPFYKIGGLN